VDGLDRAGRPWPSARRPRRLGRWRRGTTWLVLAACLLASSGVSAQDDGDEPPVLDAELVADVLAILGEHNVDEEALTTENLTAGAIRGIVEALGDEGHTEYLTPEEYAVARDALDGRVVGIGVVLDQRARSPAILSVIDGSPADRSGLRAGDIIATIDGAETARLPLEALADLVRGDPGTLVRLGIERAGEGGPFELDIRREDVPIDPASWARAPGSAVAVVRIVQFSEGAGRRTREVLEAAIADGAQGIVLDLRGNPGGLVDEALDVAAAFLDGGVAYREEGREGPPRDVRIPAGRAIVPELPLVVLVDYGTASSAEILASALRDGERAAIIGEGTFGTGTVLRTFDLPDGSALRVGVVNWQTSRGKVVFRVGIEPDHHVEAIPGARILRPADLERMTPEQLADSDDLPLRRAIGLLQPTTP
jgi:carboxyl-terminal processing protease